MRKLLLLIPLGIVIAFVVIQLVPYGRDHSNPPARVEPTWDSVQTRSLTVRACYDCHSNEVGWPWYSNVAPISWFVQNHVDEGRAALNFSEWDRQQEEAGDAAESVREGEMPLRSYLFLNPSARLSSSERAALIQGLEATLGQGNGRDNDDD